MSKSAAVQELGVSMWPEYTSHGGHYLDLKPHSQVRSGLGWEVRSMWEEAGNKMRKEKLNHEEL